jgi:hypothetical protein
MRAIALVLAIVDGGCVRVSIDVTDEVKDICSCSFTDVALGLPMLPCGMMLG